MSEGISLKLTGREKSELIGEGFITIILLVLLNLSIFILLNQTIASNPGLRNGIFQIKTALTFGPNDFNIWSWGNVFIAFMVIVDVVVLYWRLIRRYRQMQLRHVISELHYIADGHYDHQISFKLQGDMARVVSSINALVQSTIESMEEERRIENSKDELITNVSHDIRTPLTSIIGYLGLIEDNQYNSQEDLLSYTHTAFVKSKQMKVLVEDLFEYTKVRQTSTPINAIDFDMNQMLAQLAASFEFEAKNKGMVITSDTTPNPLMMEADTDKLGRVFNNLISNALKYGSGGKHIYLDAEKIGQEVIVKVSNDGPKIPEQSLNQLFDRFYRVEESRSQKTGGTGLGLAIAQSIVTLHGGYIYVISNDDLTSFVIHLPLNKDKKLIRKQEEQLQE
ncbi:sensor histidine kinase [Dellaglioa sp. BT-FLS60]